MNIKWEWMVEYRKCFGCQTTKIPPWMWCACERALRVSVSVRKRRKSTCACAEFMVLASVYCSAWLREQRVFWRLPSQNVNEQMCFNCVLRRLHIRFREFNCFYFGCSFFDSIILISNVYFKNFLLFFPLFNYYVFEPFNAFIYCLLRNLYVCKTPKHSANTQTKRNPRDVNEQDAVRPNRKIRLLNCLYQAQLKHRVQLACTLESVELRLITRE